MISKILTLSKWVNICPRSKIAAIRIKIVSGASIRLYNNDDANRVSVAANVAKNASEFLSKV